MLFSTRYLFAQLSPSGTAAAPNSSSGNLSTVASQANMATTLQPVPTTYFGKYKLATSENFDQFLKEIGKFLKILIEI